MMAMIPFLPVKFLLARSSSPISAKMNPKLAHFKRVSGGTGKAQAAFFSWSPLTEAIPSGSIETHTGPEKEPSLTEIAAELEHAKERALIAWHIYRIDKENPRLLIRYVRTLNRCERLRNEMKKLIQGGIA